MSDTRDDGYILLDAGSGGMATHRLIQSLFARCFSNPILDRMDDAAYLPSTDGAMAMSTDSYTVTPLFFPGGSIGTLAVHGTVNDVAMLGARPLYMSCAFILEEGLSFSTLSRIVEDMGRCARDAGVFLVTGDTKVVPKGACDQCFITTTGIGRVLVDPAPSGSAAKPGDCVLVSGALGDHGLTIMNCREDLPFVTDVVSDSAPLASLVESLLAVCPVHVLRDPTRGGLSTTLNEIALQSNVEIRIQESSIPVHDSVRAACSALGLDPLSLANEGKCLCFVPMEAKDAALSALRSHPLGREAACIGRVEEGASRVILETPIGGRRVLGMLEGAQLPRIC